MTARSVFTGHTRLTSRSLVGAVSLAAAIAVSGCATSAEPENYSQRKPIDQVMIDYNRTVLELRDVISEQADVGPWKEKVSGIRAGCPGEKSLELRSGITPLWSAGALPEGTWPRVRDAVIEAAAESGFTRVGRVYDEPTYSLTIFNETGAEIGLSVPTNATNMSIISGCHPRGPK
jgi:hypothetical protein